MIIKPTPLITLAVLLAWAPAGLAIDGPIVQDMRSELSKACRNEVVKANPKANNKTTGLYCDCYAQETVAGIDEADLGAMLTGRETAHFTSVTEASARFCQEKHIVASTQAQLRNAKFEELPDLGNPDFVRTKSGVFAAKASGKVSVVMDNEQMYMLNFGDYICGWMATPAGKQPSKEIFNEIKNVGTALAQSMLRSSDARLTRFEESNVRGRPAAFMELRGSKALAGGQAEDQIMAYSTVIEAGSRAIVNGVCVAGASQYERHKERIRGLSTAAMAARRYKD